MNPSFSIPHFPLPDHRLLLGQVCQVVPALGVSGYVAPVPVLGGATVGQHVRHCIEFYQLLGASALKCAAVCYDNRPRQPLLETDPTAALLAFETSIATLETLPPEIDLVLKAKLAESESCIVTTLARELLYLHEHTLHHLALVAVACRAHFPAIALPAGFGVAPSTLRARF